MIPRLHTIAATHESQHPQRNGCYHYNCHDGQHGNRDLVSAGKLHHPPQCGPGTLGAFVGWEQIRFGRQQESHALSSGVVPGDARGPVAHMQADHLCKKGSTNFSSMPKTSMVLSCLATRVKDNGISGLMAPDLMTR